MGFVLGGLTSEEAVEIFEAQPGWPVVEWPRRSDFRRGGVVPLPKRCGGVAVVAQDIGLQGAAFRNTPGIAVPIVRELSDLTVPHKRVVASGEQRGARRRAHRRGVEAIEPHTGIFDRLERRGVDITAQAFR